jgi:hypothetical protein
MQRIYTRSLDFVQREVAGECILIPIRRQLTDVICLYVLNETGAAVWRRIDGKRTLQDISLELADEFDVTPAQLQSDLTSLIEDLLSIHALQEAGQTE